MIILYGRKRSHSAHKSAHNKIFCGVFDSNCVWFERKAARHQAAETTCLNIILRPEVIEVFEL